MAPVFLLGGAGFAWVRPGFEYRIQLVRRLAMPLAVPCLVFTSLMQTRIAPEALTVVALAAIAGYAAITGGRFWRCGWRGFRRALVWRR